MDESAPERYALFPLTVFDKLFERTTFVTGWLVEGTIESAALSAALHHVTRKWRMLSGRLQSVKEQEVSCRPTSPCVFHALRASMPPTHSIIESSVAAQDSHRQNPPGLSHICTDDDDLQRTSLALCPHTHTIHL